MLAREYGAKPYYDYRRLIEEPGIQMVDIAASDEVHCEIAVAAARRGKHVLVEKPLATTIEDARLMIETAEKNNIKIMCAQSCRHVPRIRKIADIVHAGRIGEPVFARILIGAGGNNWTPENPYVQRYADSPHFLLLHNGMHSVDMACWLFGELPGTVYAIGHNGRNEIPLYEYFSVQMEFTNGRTAITEENRIMNFPNFPGKTDFYVVGTKGTICYNSAASGMYAYTREGYTIYPLSSSPGSNPFAAEIASFIDSIINNRRVEIPIRFSGNVLSAILTAIESLKNNRCEKVSYVF